MFQGDNLTIFQAHKYAAVLFCVLLIGLRGQHIYFQTQTEGSFITIVMCVMALAAIFKPSRLSFWYLVAFLSMAAFGLVFVILEQLENDGLFYGWNWVGLLIAVLVAVSICTLVLSAKVKGVYFGHS